MGSSFLTLTILVAHLLIALGLLVALGFAIARRRSLGRAGVLAITGLGLLILNTLLELALPLYTRLGIRGAADVIAFFSAFNIVTAAVWSVGMALVIVAVFIGRRSLIPDADQPSPPAGPLF